jgi:hypothetical protein
VKKRAHLADQNHRLLPEATVARIQAKHIRTCKLALPFVSFVIGQNSVNRVSKPNRAVGLNHDIIWRIEPLPFESIAQYRPPTIPFGSRDTPRPMLARSYVQLDCPGGLLWLAPDPGRTQGQVGVVRA